MYINFIQLFEQFKKFIQQENGSWFSFFLYLFAGLFLGDWLQGRLSAYGISQNVSIVIVMTVVLGFCLVWFLTKKVTIKEGRINIGVADLLIIHVSDSTPLTYDQRIQLANESSQYFFSQIQSQIYDGSSLKQINLVKLPSRVQVNFENDKSIAQDLKLDILVRGALKFIDGKYYINYKFTFPKRIESWAFGEIIQSINSYKDVEFDLHGETALIRVFVNQLLWLALLLSAIKDYSGGKYLLAHATLEDINLRIKQTQLQFEYPVDYVIQYLNYFLLMKNYIAMQGSDVKNSLEEPMQDEWIDACIQQSFDSMICSIKSYFKCMKHDSVHDNQFEMELLYALGRNPNHQNNEQDLGFMIDHSDYPEKIKDLLGGYFSMKKSNLLDAKSYYQQVIEKDHDNLIALRSLGIIEYYLGNYAFAKQHLENYWNNNTQHIFYRHYTDIKVIKLLINCSLRTHHIVDSFRYTYQWTSSMISNRKLKKKYIIL